MLQVGRLIHPSSSFCVGQCLVAGCRQDGTFLKIDDINLAYTFPLKKLTNGYVHSVRAYVNIHNAATFTNYEGVDPEVNITGYDGGIDSWGSYYPRTRTYVFGLKLNF